MSRFNGEVAIVTGAGSGNGGKIARVLRPRARVPAVDGGWSSTGFRPQAS